MLFAVFMEGEVLHRPDVHTYENCTYTLSMLKTRKSKNNVIEKNYPQKINIYFCGTNIFAEQQLDVNAGQKA